MAKQENKVQRVCFTVNNYTDADYQMIIRQADLCKFMVVGKETGENGTPHLQGFANLKKRTRFCVLKGAVPSAHFEKANGTDQQNLAYCTKQDKNAFIHGEPSGRGKRNDLKQLTEAVMKGKPMQEVAEIDPVVFAKYNRGLRTLAETIKKPRDRNDPPVVLWLWGRTGVGKTRFAHDQFAEGQVYIKDSTIWWDGYEQQECILIDDFANKFEFDYLLRLLDRYAFRGQIKGGYVQINSPFIIVTSEFPPQTYWRGTALEQVVRRITMIEEIKK